MELADELKQVLETRGACSELARITKLDRITILKIATGKTQNPGIKTVAVIKRGLETMKADAEAQRRAGAVFP